MQTPSKHAGDAALLPTAVKPPKLLDQVKRCIRDKHYSLRTEEAYVYWIRWYIRYHGVRHPMDMGAAEVAAFLSHLTNERNVSVSTHKQALCALLFLYKQVLQTDFPWLEDIYRPNRPPRLPTVLTEWEVAAVLDEMKGVHALMCRLLYGTGMRMMECMTLRIKDVDFGRREIMIREGKGRKDRVTMLPLALVAPLREQIARARLVCDEDRAGSRPGVMLPDALDLKYSKAATQWGWFQCGVARYPVHKNASFRPWRRCKSSRYRGIAAVSRLALTKNPPFLFVPSSMQHHTGFFLRTMSRPIRDPTSCDVIICTSRRFSVPSSEPSRRQS